MATRAKVPDPKEPPALPVRAPSLAKPSKGAPAQAVDHKAASASRKEKALSVVAPATARSRLVLEPLDIWLESPVALRATPELLMAPSPEASVQRAQAADLWKSLNTQPEDLQKDVERLKTLEANAAAVRKQATKEQAEVAQLREQLERVEQERFPAMVV